MLMDVELRQLRAFIELARERSFTRAAERLHITQPALTRTIQQLETAVRARLFDRSSRHVALTAEGRELLEPVERALGELNRAVDALHQRGTVRLGFSWLMPDPWAQKTIDEFERSCGHRVQVTRCEDPLADLRRHTIDIALVRGDVDAERSIRLVHLFDEARVAVACSIRSELRDAESIDWREVPRWPLVANVVSGATGPWSWSPGAGPASVIETANYDEWVEAVAANRGIGVAPASGRRRINHPGVMFIPLLNAPAFPVRLAYLPQSQRLPLRRFIDVAVASVD